MLSRQQRRAIERNLPPEATSYNKDHTSEWANRSLDIKDYIFSLIARFFTIPILTIGFAATIFAIYVYFAESIPYIEPDQVISSSWHDLPFKAKIDSHFFGASDIEVVCTTNRVSWIGNGKSRVFSGKAFVKVDRIQSVLGPRSTITFFCNMAEANSTTPSGDVNPVHEIDVILQMTYRSFVWPWGDLIIPVPWWRQIISPRFRWQEVSPGNFQWLEGAPASPPKVQ
jgi:hypothetical protein